MSKKDCVQQVEDWIKKIVPGKSFADVGGLWGTVGERVSMAARYNPASLAMVDCMSPGGYWDRFSERMQEFGIDPAKIKQVRADAEGHDFVQKAGKYDVVYSSGLLYHTPDPMHFLLPLGEIANEYLICGSIVLTDTVMNKLQWNEAMPGSIFVPALTEGQRKILTEVYAFPEGGAAGGVTHVEKEWLLPKPNEFGVRHNSAPYWWLHAPSAVEAMLNIVGFDVIDQFNGWEDRMMFFICKRKAANAD